MSRLGLLLLLLIPWKALVPEVHYTLPYGEGKNQYSSAGIESMNNTFSISPDGESIVIPDPRKQALLLIPVKDGQATSVPMPCSYDDIFIDSLWHIYFLSSGERIIYLYNRSGQLLDKYQFPETDMAGKFIIYGKNAYLKTQGGLWNIITRQYATEYIDCEVKDSRLDLFVVKDNNPHTILSVDLQNLGAKELYPYPGIEYIGRIGQYFIFDSYGIVFDNAPSQILVIDSKGQLVQHIARPDDVYFSQHQALISLGRLYQTLFTPKGIDIYVYRLME